MLVTSYLLCFIFWSESSLKRIRQSSYFLKMSHMGAGGESTFVDYILRLNLKIWLTRLLEIGGVEIAIRKKFG